MSDDVGGWNVTDDGRPHARVSPSAGVLASGGASPVHARVHLSPTPQIVPADLVDVLDPVRDAAGTLTDWRLNPAKLVSAHPSTLAATRDTYTRWRSAYVTERLLGDLATIRAFLTWAAPHTDISALRSLSAPDVRIDPATATRVASQVDAAAVAARASHDTGLGIATPTRPGLIRGFVVTDQPLVVLAAGTAHLSASRSGLELVQTTATAPFPAAVLAAAPTHAWKLAVTGWNIEADGVTALTDVGEVDLGDSVAGKLLAYTAPGAAHVRVYPVPLTSVFADLLVELPQLALLAARHATPLHVTH